VIAGLSTLSAQIWWATSTRSRASIRPQIWRQHARDHLWHPFDPYDALHPRGIAGLGPRFGRLVANRRRVAPLATGSNLSQGFNSWGGNYEFIRGSRRMFTLVVRVGLSARRGVDRDDGRQRRCIPVNTRCDCKNHHHRCVGSRFRAWRRVMPTSPRRPTRYLSTLTRRAASTGARSSTFVSTTATAWLLMVSVARRREHDALSVNQQLVAQDHVFATVDHWAQRPK